ncbi:NAD-dependent epimerase [Leptolyngbya iicbica]|uniref:NAD-dependent epimerase n=2 Tax=Cyanophyceae TaxID=3028117 RepID=A0A4Q7EA24_9CYAN|nr:NAD-dependent epimerase [Leptolyngbya sp. LK]RZM79294.1 NAD-dependent epimerase [Leptolyngbya sp. LK]
MTILITGAAGFIGFHVSRKLLDAGQEVYGIDNLNDYYSVQLKRDRLAQITADPKFTFQKIDLNDRSGVEKLFSQNSFTHVIHLAAQAGVRYSLQNPYAYADSNLSGFLNILEGCRHSADLQHLIFASSSSVYGANTKVPFSTQDAVDHPVSLYAATKKANELMAHAYSHLYNFPVTGLRFFTVYGPWGRPDMAYFKFVDAIAHGRPIEVYNQGQMKRDFTYIDDVVEGIIRLLDHLPNQVATNNEINSKAQYKIYNIGNHQPVELIAFIEVIEKAMGKSAKKIMKPMQPGDVVATHADINDLMIDIDFKPATSVENGIQKFIEWYLCYYKE